MLIILYFVVMLVKRIRREKRIRRKIQEQTDACDQNKINSNLTDTSVPSPDSVKNHNMRKSHFN